MLAYTLAYKQGKKMSNDKRYLIELTILDTLDTAQYDGGDEPRLVYTGKAQVSSDTMTYDIVQTGELMLAALKHYQNNHAAEETV